MNDVTQILLAIENGDPFATHALMPVVYDELRRMAAQKLAREPDGSSFQATALVHEALLRWVGPNEDKQPTWNSREHFFGAAAEAMRRILVDAARKRNAAKRGGGAISQNIDELQIESPSSDVDLLAIDDVLDQLDQTDPVAARLVKLRFFAGFSMTQVAEALGISVRSTHDVWTYARAWLRQELGNR